MFVSGKKPKMNKQTVAASEVIVGLPEKGFLQFYIQICILWTSVGFARRLISQFRYFFPLYMLQKIKLKADILLCFRSSSV